ncbi:MULTISPECIES: hypothetical protein [Streptomyces]|uniref:hypothetical protein n=1 Tax=Streptomyces TaxID=1883 RepID=UPI003656454A
MTLDRYDSALKMRDIIRRLSRQVVNTERPPDKIGRVVDVDRGGGTAKVVFAGDEANPVRVAVFPGMQPPKTDRINGDGMGSIVRVSGPVGGRFISEVRSEAAYSNNPKLFNPAFMAGGDANDSLVSEVAVQVDAPAASSSVDVATLTVPNRAANISISCELVGSGDSFVQTGRIIFDWSAAQATVLTGTVDASSSTGMNLTFTYTVNADQVTVTLTRGTGTRTFTTANVMMRCFGTNISMNAEPDSGA